MMKNDKNSLKKINDNIKKIKESGLPVDYLTSINVQGCFIIKEPQNSEDYCNYVGKIIGNGILATMSRGSSYPSDHNTSTEYREEALIVYNIAGFSFKASTSCEYYQDVNSIDNINSSHTYCKLKIDTLYNNYKVVTTALENHIEDGYIKDVFGLDSFESSKVNTKQKIKK